LNILRYAQLGEESPGTKEQDARENEQAVRFENSATENKPPLTLPGSNSPCELPDASLSMKGEG